MLSEMADLLRRLPAPPPPRSLHAHPAAVDALSDMCAPPEPAPPFPGASLGSLTGIPVITDDDMKPGAWEIREGDKVISSGAVRSPWMDIFRPANGEQDA